MEDILVPSRQCLNKVHSSKIRLIFFLNKRKENILSTSKKTTMKTILSWRCAFFWQMLGAVAQPAIPMCMEKLSPRDLDGAYRGPVSRNGCHPLPGVCKGNQQQDGFWWYDPGLKTEVSGTQADTGILEIYRFFGQLGFLEAMSRQSWHLPIRLYSSEFSFMSPGVVQPLSLYEPCILRSPSTRENKPSHQGDPDCPLLGVTAGNSWQVLPMGTVPLPHPLPLPVT